MFVNTKIIKENIFNFWSIFSLILLFVIFLPIGYVFSTLFQSFNPIWTHLIDTVLLEYVLTSIFLTIGVIFGSLLLGIPTAWLVSDCDFPLKKFFSWSLLLPFALPSYVLAYTMTDMFSSYGSVNHFFQFLFNDQDIYAPNIRNIWGAIITLSLVFYPYIYLLARATFLRQSISMVEASRTLGKSPLESFLGISLPIARPAIFAGIALVGMETLSEFGAVQHFALYTLTTGIYQTWFGLGDLKTACQLSSFLLLSVMIFLIVENYMRVNMRFDNSTSTYRPIPLYKLKKTKSFMAVTVCTIPILFGFLFPGIQLVSNAISYGSVFVEELFISAAINSLMLGLISSLLIVLLCLILVYGSRINKNITIKTISKLCTLGYGTPGLVLGVGILVILTGIDHEIYDLQKRFMGNDFNGKLILTGSVIGLLLAYLVKFFALSFNNLDSGLAQVTTSMEDAARTLGLNKYKVLRKVHVPLLKVSILTALIMVFLEVIQELPATLILRPFNFETLATVTYMYASDERMIQAAAPSLAIVLISLVPLVAINNIISKSRERKV